MAPRSWRACGDILPASVRSRRLASPSCLAERLLHQRSSNFAPLCAAWCLQRNQMLGTERSLALSACGDRIDSLASPPSQTALVKEMSSPRHQTTPCPASAGLLSTKFGHAPISWDQPTKRNVASAMRYRGDWSRLEISS